MKCINVKICSTLFFVLFWSCIAYGQELHSFGAAITVNDIEIATDWYKKVFEVEVANEMNFPEYDSLKIRVLKNDHFQLELLQKKTSFRIQKFVPAYSVNDKPLIGIFKMVFKTENIDKLYERLEKIRVSMITKIVSDKANGIKYFIISDSDENTIQFIEML
jgi:predicted enzyme related to lactoylglutathione lyase